jgi:diguanylate cyclase (GGDEF)-like protein/PAS domain S-box-containing protein
MAARGGPTWAQLVSSFEVSPIATVLHDAAGRIVAVNPAAVALLGRDAGELLGQSALPPHLGVVHSDGTPVVTRDIPAVRVLDTGRADAPRILGVRRAGGALVWVRVTSRPLGAGGALTGVALFLEDVTAVRDVEERLERSEEQLRLALDAASVGLWELDLDTGELTGDASLARLIGRPAWGPPMPVRQWLEVIHADDRARALEEFRRAGDSDGIPARDRYRLVRPDGSIRWVIAQSAIVEDDRTRRVVGAIVDVTDQEFAHDRVRELLEAMTDAYYAVDDRWRVTYLNTRACQLLGRSREAMLGRSLSELFPEAVGGEVEARYLEVQGTGEPTTFETYYAAHERWYEFRVYPVAGGLAVHFRDVSERHHAEVERERLLAATSAALAQAQASRAELEHAALHDLTTGLPNRAGFLRWLEDGADELGPTDEAGRWDLGVLLVDLDRFRHVNDVHGHGEGDRLLHEVADRLRDTVDDRAFLGRLSGDEFLVAVRAVTVDELLALADLVLRALRRPFPTGGQLVVVTGTIGAAFATEGRGAEALRDADSALSRAKDAGGDRVASFDEERRRQTVARLRLETDLRFALEQRQLGLHHQPFYTLADGRCGGSEALLRWTHPALGPVAPDRFIPLAEETGLIVPLGDLVVTDAVRLAAAPAGPPGAVWCNVSGRQLEQPGFADRVLAQLDGAGVPPRRFGVEVTESVLIEHRPEVAEALTRLSDGGVLIAVDDFGTGYSSLARLSTYPVDVLKIDRSFVAGLPDRSRALVAAITDLGHALGVSVCAEGVETWTQLEVLRDLGVDQACGFLLARPVPADALADEARAGRTTLLTAV